MREHFAAKARALAMRGRDIADLAAIEIGERAAEREDGAEGVALVHLRFEHP